MAKFQSRASRVIRTRAITSVVILTAIILTAILRWDDNRVSVGTSPPLELTSGKLADPSQSVRLLVIGDSTSNDADEWVSLTAQHLADSKGRMVAMTTWEPDTERFGREIILAGSGRPITIINFSSPGATPPYNLLRLSKVAADRPDLVIVNQGHNSPDVEAEVGALVTELRQLWPQPPEIAVIDQNPRTDDPNQSQAAAVGMDALADSHPYIELVDVRSAFRSNGGAELLTDGLHPNSEGSHLWARTVWAALGIS
ncbi:SGNH/GDSL hydrolase family protein [Dietzia sp. KRD202]|uniref:SGNH/GDSL hydrolase family protein n=1 Tax=Dietzia sp. KRD202 TaxID=2729732 RepID=UPI0019D063CF